MRREILKEEQIARMETEYPSMLGPGHHPLWLEHEVWVW